MPERQIGLGILRSYGSTDSRKYELTETIELSPNGPVVAVNVPIDQWHTVRALESGSVILEMKDGAYTPLSPEDVLE